MRNGLQVFASSVTVTVDGAHTIGDTVVDVTDASNVTVGDVVTGTGIASGTTISSIAGDAITLSAAITGNLADGATLSVAVNKGRWIAKYPGSLGNSLAISVCTQTSTNAAFTAWSYKSNFSAAPGTSDYAASVGGSNDELHIVVIDEDGAWTGTSGTILETFAFVSQASDAKTNDGASNYYKDVINNQSQYIWWGSHPSELTNAGATAAGQTFANSVTGGNTTIDDSLVGGVDSGTLGTAEIQGGFDLVEDAETIGVSLLIMPSVSSANAVTIANDLISIAEARKDCVAFVSPAVTATTSSLTPKDDVITFADSLTSSSYAVIDSTSLKIYDKYNDQYINIPASSSVAGLCANTDNVADAWFSPAGYTRGQLRGVTKINFNPKKAERDELYLARVNPIVTFPGEGTVLFGDKTAQAKPSAFDRINVRRLFIVLEKAIATAAKYQLFEFNDEFTRAQFRNLVEPFLREVKGRRGLTDFQVVCDETNNTGDVIDRNEFVADIYIKPARSINFISLNFIATRTGVEFSEIIGQ